MNWKWTVAKWILWNAFLQICTFINTCCGSGNCIRNRTETQNGSLTSWTRDSLLSNAGIKVQSQELKHNSFLYNCITICIIIASGFSFCLFSFCPPLSCRWRASSPSDLLNTFPWKFLFPALCNNEESNDKQVCPHHKEHSSTLFSPTKSKRNELVGGKNGPHDIFDISHFWGLAWISV